MGLPCSLDSGEGDLVYRQRKLGIELVLEG